MFLREGVDAIGLAKLQVTTRDFLANISDFEQTLVRCGNPRHFIVAGVVARDISLLGPK